jgi:hypothetical protein
MSAQRKPRVEKGGRLKPLAWLKAQPPAERADLLALIKKHSYAEALPKIKTPRGIKLSAAALSVFYAWQSQQQRLENHNQLVAQFEEFYRKANPDASQDKVRDMAIAFFLSETTANQDREGFVEIVKLMQSREKGKRDEAKIGLESRKVALLEKKAAAFDQVKKAVSSGGLTPETLTRIERELKLL